MELLVDLSFTRQDRLELLRCVLYQTPFYKRIHNNPDILVGVTPSTSPAPSIFPDPFSCIERFGAYRPLSILARLLRSFYTWKYPLVIQDICSWFPLTLFNELERIPEFAAQDTYARKLCGSFFSTYAGGHLTTRISPFSIVFERLLLQHRQEPYRLSEETEGITSEPSVSAEVTEKQGVVAFRKEVNEDGSQTVSVPKETKELLDKMFHEHQQGDSDVTG